MATARETVVIVDFDYGDVDIERAIIEPAGFELIAAQCKTEDEVIEAARGAAAVVAQYATLSARVIAELGECRVIARYGTGVDIVDVDAATRHNILVTNVPNEWCEDEVADHAMALLLAVARKIGVYDRATRDGIWQWQSGAPIHRLRGSVLGLLSFGAIARAIGARAAGFGMRITAHDPFVPAEEVAAAGADAVWFDELVTESDCLVIQAPLTSDSVAHSSGPVSGATCARGDVVVLHGAHRAQDVDLAVAQIAFPEADGRLHGHQAQQLQEMVLHHVLERADVVVVAGSPLQRERLVPDDLDLVDVSAVPDRLEHAVGQACSEHVLHGRHREEVIDAKHVALVHQLREKAIERRRAVEVLSKRLLEDHLAVGGNPGPVERRDRSREDGRRQREVDRDGALTRYAGRDTGGIDEIEPFVARRSHDRRGRGGVDPAGLAL